MEKEICEVVVRLLFALQLNATYDEANLVNTIKAENSNYDRTLIEDIMNHLSGIGIIETHQLKCSLTMRAKIALQSGKELDYIYGFTTPQIYK